MPKLTQKAINKQVGSSKFKTPEKCCGTASFIQKTITGIISEPATDEDFILDSNNINILDSANLPLMST